MAQSDQIKYSVVEGWEQLPKGWAHRDVAGVAVDQEDRVYLICRGDHPVIIYDNQGNFKRSWGEGDFSHRTHGIYIAPNGTIFCTDDGNHTVRQFTPEGKLLMTMGVLNTPSDTGYDGKTVASIKRTAGPFNRPTNVAIGLNGDIYISDGYGNARVHIFSPKGELKRSWGEPGKGPRAVPSAARHRGRCRRIGLRMRPRSRPHPDLHARRRVPERMDRHAAPDASLLRCKGRAYVTELAWYEGDTSFARGKITKDKTRHARMSIYDKNGKMLARWGTPQCDEAPGSFAAPHGLALDSKNDLYVSEVTWTVRGEPRPRQSHRRRIATRSRSFR
jgi:hypothetical protein